MPSRFIRIMIVAFWIGSVGWFGYREVWPRFNSNEAPPFVIELADEATSQLPLDPTRTADVLWNVLRGDKEIGRAQTRLRYLKEDDSFELQSRIVELKLGGNIEFPEIISTYKLSRAGELMAIRTNGRMRIFGLIGKADFNGVVQGDRLIRTGEVDLPILGKKVLQLEPTEAPKGSFLNPMHPVPRVTGLKPGRRWRMLVQNPMSDVIGPALKSIQTGIDPKSKPIELKLQNGPEYLDAEVLTETATLKWNNREHECYIIEYRGENKVFRTFVRIIDGLVLKQESEAFEERFTMVRY